MKAKNMEELIQKKYDELNENDLEIWKYIISNKETCKQISIQQLAVFCHVSHTTILRFAKKTGIFRIQRNEVFSEMGRTG